MWEEPLSKLDVGSAAALPLPTSPDPQQHRTLSEQLASLPPLADLALATFPCLSCLSNPPILTPRLGHLHLAVSLPDFADGCNPVLHEIISGDDEKMMLYHYTMHTPIGRVLLWDALKILINPW